jgi:hypothetical protein
VVADSVKPYRSRKRLNDTEKVSLGIAIILFVFVTAILLLPWVFKFMLIVAVYAFVFIVSKGDYTTPAKGGKSDARVPGASIIPRL